MKKIAIKGMALLLAGLLLAGCGLNKEKSASDYVIYYLDDQASFLKKEVYEARTPQTSELIDEMIAEFTHPTQAEDVKSPIPKKVKIKETVLEEGRLDVYFNEAYNDMSKAREVLLRAAFVQTVVQIPGVEYVSFYIGGDPLKRADGTPVGYMDEKDFVQNADGNIRSYEKAELTLYFANKSGKKLVRETVNIHYNSNVSLDKLAVENLLKGPSGEGAYPTLPSQTKVLGVSVRDGVCYVNLDQGIFQSTYNVQPDVVVYSIVNSVIDSGAASQVQISINGDSNGTFGGNVRLDKPLSRNLDIVEE